MKKSIYKQLRRTDYLRIVCMSALFISLVTGYANSQQYAQAVEQQNNMSNAAGALLEDGNSNGFATHGSNNYLTVSFGTGYSIPGNSEIILRLQRNSAGASNANVYFSSNNGSTWSSAIPITLTTSNWSSYSITSPGTLSDQWTWLKLTTDNNMKTDWILANGALPVELISFSAFYRSNKVTLNWKTATEINNYGFAVERQTGKDWNQIGFVEGHGTVNTPQQYSFVDNNPVRMSEISYRLKQIDRDGATVYSPVVQVKMNVAQSVVLGQNYPNPFNPTTNISFTLDGARDIKLKVYDITGKLVTTLASGSYQAGNYIVPFDGSMFSSGTYHYQLESDGNIIVKQMQLTK